MKVSSSDADLAALQLQYADNQQPAVDDSDDPEQITLQEQQQDQKTLEDNLRADKDSTTGVTDSQISMANRVHVMANDGIVPAEAGIQQQRALQSIQSGSLDAPTQRVAGLQDFSIRDFDTTKRA